MNKFKKMMSVTLAGCMAASALMMSAGAANVQTGTTPAPVAAPQNVRGTVTPSSTPILPIKSYRGRSIPAMVTGRFTSSIPPKAE